MRLEKRKLPLAVIPFCAVAFTLLILSTNVQAQEPARTVSADRVLDEIIVTNRRRNTSLQKTVLSVSVVSGDMVDDENITKLDDFNGMVPGLNITKNDGAGRVVAIRGVGWETAQNLSTQPGVLFYIDGVYVANPLAIGMDIGDLDRVEVFRGPQGTEFGQNTTGGAINIITKRPDFDGVSGGAEIAYGSYNLLKLRAHINVPLNDSLAVRASLQRHKRDGFAKVSGTALAGYGLDDADSVTGKLALLWKPNTDVSVHATGFWQDADQHGAAAKSGSDPNLDPRRLTQDYPSTFALKNSQYSVIAEWQTKFGALKTISSYQSLKKHQTADADRVDFATAGFYDVVPLWDNTSKAYTQEVNFSSLDDQAFQWLVGGYYLHHENFQDILELVGTIAPRPGDLDVPTIRPLSFPENLRFQTTDTVLRKDAALYGQFNWDVSKRFSFMGGVRYQSDKSTSDVSVFYDLFGPPTTAKNQDTAWTWKVGAHYKLTPNSTLYGLVSTGYRNGGNNGGSLNAFNVSFNFKPETVTAYEIGAKNEFFDRRLRLNMAGFYYDYKDYQFIAEDAFPFSGGADNIPAAKIYGAEAEFTWLLSDQFQFDGFVSSNDGTFTQDFSALDVVDIAEIGAQFNVPARIALLRNLNGNEPAKLVDLMARASLTHTLNIASSGVLTSKLEYIHRGEFEYRVFNNPSVDTVPAYDLVNLHFAFAPSNERYHFSLSMTNLFDENGINSRFTNPYGTYITSNEYIPPRQIVGTFRVSF